ncbi:MAG: pyridoxamine 5'-phosphate oxidase family protein [Pseudomonadota bacterium]
MLNVDGKPFDFSGSLDATWDMIWQLLVRGVADRYAPERHPTLATTGLDGSPQLRTVVLRAVDRAETRLDCHTDLRSAKISELETDPRCAIHIWNPKRKLQMRIGATAELQAGADVDDVWQRVPEVSRHAYGGTHLPGAPIDDPTDFEPAPERTRFGVVMLGLHSVETLCLAPDRHYRALYLKEDDWRGQWLAP